MVLFYQGCINLLNKYALCAFIFMFWFYISFKANIDIIYINLF